MDNQYSYYNPNETEGNTSNGTAFYNNGQGDDGKTPKKKKEHKKIAEGVAVTGLALMFGVVSSATFLTTNYVGTKVLKLGTTQKSTSTTSTSAVTSNASLTKTSSVVTSDVSSVSRKCNAIYRFYYEYECIRKFRTFRRNFQAGKRKCRYRNHHFTE